jgi:hypothetical protein
MAAPQIVQSTGMFLQDLARIVSGTAFSRQAMGEEWAGRDFFRRRKLGLISREKRIL